jgi:carbonic anhydrase
VTRKTDNNTEPRRIQVTLVSNTRQEINRIAEEELRPPAVQAAYFVELGLLAHGAGYRIKNGNLKRFEQREIR